MSTDTWFRLGLLVVVVLAVSVVVGAQFGPSTPTPPSKTSADVKYVYLGANGSARLWPYTSRGRSFEQATLPINLLVHDDAATVQRLLAYDPSSAQGLYWDASAETWTAGDPGSANVTINGTGIRWGQSAGSDRYIFVLADGSGKWLAETYQLHDGTYFGSRYHLRLYGIESANNSWTAIQAHYEYWDWFTLRHRVNSLVRAQHAVERDFLSARLLTGISRERWANGGAIDADGWVTIIDIRERVRMGPRELSLGPVSENTRAVLPLIGVSITAAFIREYSAIRSFLTRTRQRLPWHLVALFTATAGLPLVVRIGAIAIERIAPNATPLVVGAPFYLMLVLGLPTAAWLFGRRLSPVEGFGTAVLGLGTGLMLDYAYLGVAAIPFGAVVHRVGLLFGLGLIAAGGVVGSTERLDRYPLHLAGMLIWVGSVIWPFLGGL